MNLDDFKNIDFKNAGSLPGQVKLVLITAAFSALTALGYYFVWIPSIDELDQVVAKEQDLRKSFLDKKEQAINLPGYKEQMVEIERTFGNLLKQLPDKSKMDGLLMDINQAGLSRNLEFALFKPAAEIQSEFYAETPISIKVLGSYHDLGAFSTDISKLSRIVTLNDIAIKSIAPAASKDPKAPVSRDYKLEMEATAKTYRYLDADEISAKKKTEADKKKKNRPAPAAAEGGSHGPAE